MPLHPPGYGVPSTLRPPANIRRNNTIIQRRPVAAINRFHRVLLGSHHCKQKRILFLILGRQTHTHTKLDCDRNCSAKRFSKAVVARDDKLITVSNIEQITDKKKPSNRAYAAWEYTRPPAAASIGDQQRGCRRIIQSSTYRQTRGSSEVVLQELEEHNLKTGIAATKQRIANNQPKTSMFDSVLYRQRLTSLSSTNCRDSRQRICWRQSGDPIRVQR